MNIHYIDENKFPLQLTVSFIWYSAGLKSMKFNIVVKELNF